VKSSRRNSRMRRSFTQETPVFVSDISPLVKGKSPKSLIV